MEEILKVQGLKKTFKLSAKQQKIEKTNEKIKVAVNDLLPHTEERSLDFWVPTARARRRHCVCWQP